MMISVKAKEPCFYGGQLRKENEQFLYAFSDDYKLLAKEKGVDVIELLPKYLKLANASSKKLRAQVTATPSGDSVLPTSIDELNKMIADAVSLAMASMQATAPMVAPVAIDAPVAAGGQSESNDSDIDNDALKKALLELDKNNASHWDDRNNKPNLKHLSLVVGRKVTRAEVDDIADELVRPV